MGKLRTGLVAGALATLPMTVIILGGRQLGLFHSVPPKQIAQAAADQVGLDELAREPAFGPIWLVLHVAFGAGWGALYPQLARHLPLLPLAQGLSYGLLVWGINYLGLMPLLGLFPGPRQAGGRRTAVMVLAHLLYGMSLARLSSNMSNRSVGT